MSLLNNRHWITLDGSPISGRTPPELRVYGPPMTGAQESQVRHVYKLFTDVCLVAVGDYQVRRRELADGTRIRCTSFLGRDVVEVWTAGGGEPPVETLFYGRPSSTEHRHGYVAPEETGTTTIWREYNKASEAPEKLKYIGSSELLGESTWYSTNIKLNIKDYSPVMPVVVSWKGRGYRYGAYGPKQPNYKSLYEEIGPTRAPTIFPGGTYGWADNGAGNLSVWVNDTEFSVTRFVFSAALKHIEGEGVYLYVVETPDAYEMNVYRSLITLPLKKGYGGTLALTELVVSFDVYNFTPYQGPFFNESCTKLVTVAVVETETDEFRTCLVELDLDSQSRNIIHSAKRTITTAGYTSEMSWSATVDDITYAPSRRVLSQEGVAQETIDSPEKNVVEYVIAADYIKDELVYVLGKVTWGSTANTPGDKSVEYSYLALQNTYPSYSGSYTATFADELKFELIHSERGVIYAKSFSGDGYENVSISMSGVGSFGQPTTASGNVSYRQSTSFSSYADACKIQTVGGDLRHDFLIVSYSMYHDAWVNEFSSATESAEFVSTTGAQYGESEVRIRNVPEYSYDSSSLPVQYAVLKDGVVIYETSEPLYTISYPVPNEIVEPFDGSSYVKDVSIGYFKKIGGVGTPTSGSSLTVVEPVVYELPYTAPVSQPTNFPNLQGGDLYNAILSADGNNQPGLCCSIAWAPTQPGEEHLEVGYVSFISPRLWNANGVEVDRIEFKKWYIAGSWVDSPVYAPGSEQAIVRPIFIGTRLK